MVLLSQPVLKFIVGLGIAVASVDGFILSANAGTCQKEAREVRLGKDNVVRLSNYLCRSGLDARIRVQFQRLTGLAAGALLNDGTMPWTSAIYGERYRIISNDVLTEYKSLLTRFGSAVKEKDRGGGEDIGIFLQVTRPSQSSKDDDNGDSAHAGIGAKIRSFMLPHLPDVPLVDETVAILTEPAWPDSLNMYYSSVVSKSNSSPLDEMTVWRYLSPTDFQDYSKRLERYNKLVADPTYYTRKSESKALGLLKYLTAEGWPNKFLFSSADISLEEGCVVFDFRVQQYSVAVDIAIIENSSVKAINVDQLLGHSGGGSQLRKLGRSPAKADQVALQAEAISLAPSERLIIPLRLVLVADQLNLQDDDRLISQRQFQKIESSKQGTFFQTKVYSALRGTSAGQDMYVIRKVRESFRPPSYPNTSDFAFGPEWALTGLILRGEQIVFDVTSNLLDITASSEAGSCPVLYAWSGQEATWFRYGKIFHQAQTRANWQSETITFDGFVHRFRLAEEELERATISNVKLTIELSDGTVQTLLPDDIHPSAGSTVALYANDELELNFTLPGNLKETDVARSRLTLTGYYVRYPALLIGRH